MMKATLSLLSMKIVGKNISVLSVSFSPSDNAPYLFLNYFWFIMWWFSCKNKPEQTMKKTSREYMMNANAVRMTSSCVAMLATLILHRLTKLNSKNPSNPNLRQRFQYICSLHAFCNTAYARLLLVKVQYKIFRMMGSARRITIKRKNALMFQIGSESSNSKSTKFAGVSFNIFDARKYVPT